MRDTPIRVLIVEDNARHSALMAEELHRMTLEDRTLHLHPLPPPAPTRTCGGEDALECLRRESADVVLLDYGLPDCNGIELIEEMRAIRRDLPVVAGADPPGPTGGAEPAEGGG